HWISVRGRCLYAEDGTPLRDIGVTLDITARRRLEQDLRESEERYRLFAEAALEGVVVHDFERILDVSRRFAEMFGYRPEELIGQPVAVLESMVPPEEVAQARRRVATQHTAFNEMACLRRDGTPFTIEYAARHLTYRDRAVRLAIARDITERKRHEAALQRVNETLERQIEERARQLSASRARLRAFFDNSPDWLTLQRATADGRFVYVDLNPTCEAAYGLPRERVIGRRLEEVLGEEAAQVPLHHLREALRTGAPQRYVAHRTMAGRTRAIDVMFVLVPGAAGSRAKDGGGRPAHRRRRARLQQSADDGDHEPRHHRRIARGRAAAAPRRGRFALGDARRPAHPAASFLRPAPDAARGNHRSQRTAARDGAAAEASGRRGDRAELLSLARPLALQDRRRAIRGGGDEPRGQRPGCDAGWRRDHSRRRQCHRRRNRRA